MICRRLKFIFYMIRKPQGFGIILEYIRYLIALRANDMMMRPEEMKVFKIVEDPEEVLQAIYDFECEIDNGEHDGHLKASSEGFSL